MSQPSIPKEILAEVRQDRWGLLESSFITPLPQGRAGAGVRPREGRWWRWRFPGWVWVHHVNGLQKPESVNAEVITLQTLKASPSSFTALTPHKTAIALIYSVDGDVPWATARASQVHFSNHRLLTTHTSRNHIEITLVKYLKCRLGYSSILPSVMLTVCLHMHHGLCTFW